MLVTACLTVLLAAAGAGAANATPQSGLAPADSRQVSFAGTTFAAEADENVDVVGTLQLVTQLSGSEQTGWTLDWHANLNNTTGTGQITADPPVVPDPSRCERGVRRDRPRLDRRGQRR